MRQMESGAWHLWPPPAAAGRLPNCAWDDSVFGTLGEICCALMGFCSREADGDSHDELREAMVSLANKAECMVHQFSKITQQLHVDTRMRAQATLRCAKRPIFCLFPVFFFSFFFFADRVEDIGAQNHHTKTQQRRPMRRNSL